MPRAHSFSLGPHHRRPTSTIAATIPTKIGRSPSSGLTSPGPPTFRDLHASTPLGGKGGRGEALAGVVVLAAVGHLVRTLVESHLVVALHTFLELAKPGPQAFGELGDALPSEEHQDDHQDDDQVGGRLQSRKHKLLTSIAPPLHESSTLGSNSIPAQALAEGKRVEPEHEREGPNRDRQGDGELRPGGQV